MEDKRDINREGSPFAERNPTPSDAKTPSPVPSGSPSPLGSPSELSSHCPRSLVFEQGGSSGKAPVIDPSSSLDEEDFFAGTSHDIEFAQLKPNRIIRKHTDANCSNFHLRVFLGLLNPQG
jgi:hypothetical protein